VTNISLKDDISQITARAPATLSNLAIGFDIIGVALQAPHDQVTLKRRQDRLLVIQDIQSPTPLPLDPNKNTATIALRSMLDACQLSTGFDVFIKKGIDCGSGMGGSAASAVAAVVAANAFLNQPLNNAALLTHAVEAERITSGSAHCDNAAPCLNGGLVLCQNNQQVTPLPSPSGTLIITKPSIAISTKQARQLLPNAVPFTDITQQNSHLANWVHALHLRDNQTMAKHMVDLIVEPKRQSLWPHYQPIKRAAQNAGALMSCMSGSGPTVVSWCDDSHCEDVKEAIEHHCEQQDYDYQVWLSSWSARGAHIEE